MDCVYTTWHIAEFHTHTDHIAINQSIFYTANMTSEARLSIEAKSDTGMYLNRMTWFIIISL